MTTGDLDLFADELDADALQTDELPEMSASFSCVGCFGTFGCASSSTKGTSGTFGCAS